MPRVIGRWHWSLTRRSFRVALARLSKRLSTLAVASALLVVSGINPTAPGGGTGPWWLADLPATVPGQGGPEWDITNAAFGAKGDARWITDAAITVGTNVLTSPGQAAFGPADVGKRVDINGAVAPGASGAVFIATITAVQSLTRCTVSANATVTVSGAAASIATENAVAIQAAIHQQQTLGGRVKVPRDAYGGKYLCDPGLVAAPGSQAGGFANATRPLVIEGDGMHNSSLISGGPNTFSGLFAQPNVVLAQVIVSDLSLDGNYVGVGGALPQPASQGNALFSPIWPYTNAFAPPNPAAPTGQYHHFYRVRFFRPTSFVFQPAQGIHLDGGCVFDQVGQPDVASGGLHWDNIGSAAGDVIIEPGCSWKDSSGNYVDFTNTGVGAISRLVMIGARSRNHQIGGIYACGNRSVIALNDLDNVTAGSGIGYDATSPVGSRLKNMVVLNNCPNLTVNTSLLSFASFGDLVFGNNSGDADGAFGGMYQGPLSLSSLAGNVSGLAGLGGAQGDKIALFQDLMGIGTQANALVMWLANAAGQRFSLRLAAGAAAARSTGSEIFAFTSGNHLIIANASAPASSNKGANVTTVTAVGNDTAGVITVVMAGALAANTRIATLTFNVSYGAAAPIIILTNQTDGAGLAVVTAYVQATATGVSFDIAADQALAAGTYKFGYLVIGQTAGGA
jgi:hypothetical protein